MPAKKRALVLGVERLDKHVYGFDGVLPGAEGDAAEMASVARGAGFDRVEVLPRGKRTVGALLDGIAAAAAELRAGDLFLLSFSGHGLPVKANASEPDGSSEDDGFDESWCLFDGWLLDDYIYHALSAFCTGVRVFVVSDSCHSGTVVHLLEDRDPAEKQVPRGVAEHLSTTRRGSEATARRLLAEARRELQAGVLLLAACADDQVTRDGGANGEFTRAFLDVWAGGAFAGTYAELCERIEDTLRPRVSPRVQTPQLLFIGAGPDFRATRVFSLPSDESHALVDGPAGNRRGSPAERPQHRPQRLA